MKYFSKERLLKGVTSFFLTIILGLGMIPVSALAANGTTISLENEHINLGKKSCYTVDVAKKVPGETVTTVMINSQAVTEDGLTLTKAGDYTIELICESTTYTYDAILYRRGDANSDDERDVRDLVASYKNKLHTKTSSQYGADMDGSTQLTDMDWTLIINLLLGNELILPEPGDKIDERISISAVELETEEQLNLTFTDTSKVWQAEKGAYVAFDCYDAKESKLDTQEITFDGIRAEETVSGAITLPENTAKVTAGESALDYWSIPTHPES